MKATILVVIETATKMCRRYAGRTMTHGFVLDVPITLEHVIGMREYPDKMGVPKEPEAA